MDFLIHWPPGPVVATVQCQGLPMHDTIKDSIHLNTAMIDASLSRAPANTSNIRHMLDKIKNASSNLALTQITEKLRGTCL